MKKSNLLIAGLCTVALGLGFAASSFAATGGIVSSKHNMNNYINGVGTDRTAPVGLTEDSQGRVCAFCHTPHHAAEDMTADYLPLWSRTLSDGTFSEYDSVTFRDYSGAGAIDDPVVGPSRLCMGCHDGVIAVDAYYGSEGTAGTAEGDGWGEIGIGLGDMFGGNLSNDHPIGFDYVAAAAADSEIKDADTAKFKGTLAVADVLWEGTVMTCATCHDVHNGPNVADGQGYFLYDTQVNSAFCITCHEK